jgi:arylsulfatase A-like enzyme
MSYVRPHPPFDAPQCFFDMYRNKNLRPPFMGDWTDYERLEAEGRVFDSSTGPIDPDLKTAAQIGYYAAITQIDYEFGRFREAMFSHGLDQNNTIILFVSDHGELLCDHGLFRKSLPYQGSAGIPLVVSAPRSCIRQASGGTQQIPNLRNRIVELRDVMPTLLALCGLEIPDTVDGKNIFAPEWDREYIHGEHLYGIGSCQWIVTETDKFIWFSDIGQRQYFDLVRDPNELHNAIEDPEYAERIRKLESYLIEELRWREESFVQEEKLTSSVPVKAVLEHSRREITGS